jgi:hypothetical protein
MQRQVMEQLGEIKLSKGGGRRTPSSTTTATTPTSSTPRDTQLEVCALYACMHATTAHQFIYEQDTKYVMFTIVTLCRVLLAQVALKSHEAYGC